MPVNEQTKRRSILKTFLKHLGMQGADLTLVNTSLTHSSYSFENGEVEDNERLEFLGDAVLGFQVSHYYYEKYPKENEGALSKRKAQVVSRSVLGLRAEALGIAPLLLLGKGEEQSGNRYSSRLLGSALEALIGAFYLSLPFDKVSEFIMKRVIIPAQALLQEEEFADFKSCLQEYAQKNFQCVPEYRLMKEHGPDHNKSFTVEVFIQGKSFGVGAGSRKKVAENEAARKAIERLNKQGALPIKK